MRALGSSLCVLVLAAAALAEEEAPAPVDASVAADAGSEEAGERAPSSLPAPAQQAESRPPGPRSRLWRRRRRGKGALGVRAGVIFAAPGETADYDENFLLGLSLGDWPRTKMAYELFLDIGMPEETGIYESQPIIAGLNMLLPFGAETRSIRGCLLAGVGGMFELMENKATDSQYANGAWMLNVGGAAVFANGQLDARLTYSFFGRSENLKGQTCLTVTWRF